MNNNHKRGIYIQFPIQEDILEIINRLNINFEELLVFGFNTEYIIDADIFNTFPIFWKDFVDYVNDSLNDDSDVLIVNKYNHAYIDSDTKLDYKYIALYIHSLIKLAIKTPHIKDMIKRYGSLIIAHCGIKDIYLHFVEYQLKEQFHATNRSQPPTH